MTKNMFPLKTGPAPVVISVMLLFWKKNSGLRRKWRNCDYDKGNIFFVISDTDSQENTTQKTKDLEMGISRKSDSKVL
jgi:hypothetical protein